MGIYIRQSTNVGPVRFNLSKSGLGVSAGVKGFRVGAGPRGNYVHMGAGGIYYRKVFPSGERQENRASTTPHHSSTPVPLSESVPASSSPVQLREIESADVSGMVHGSSTDLLNEINEKKKIPRIGPWALVGAIAGMAVATTISLDPIVLSLLAVCMGSGVFFAYRRDEIRKTVVLLYDFDSTLDRRLGRSMNMR